MLNVDKYIRDTPVGKKRLNRHASKPSSGPSVKNVGNVGRFGVGTRSGLIRQASAQIHMHFKCWLPILDQSAIRQLRASQTLEPVASHKDYYTRIKMPKESKHGALGKRTYLARTMPWSKSDVRNVRRMFYRVAFLDESREALLAEYQRLVDMQLRGDLSELSRLKLKQVEAKLDQLDSEHAEHVGALIEQKRDIARMDELIRLGERLKQLLSASDGPR
jgi:hypothetical protein